MKKISIIKNNQITNQAEFFNDELLNEWLNREILNLSFGYPERDLVDTPTNPVSEELKAIAISTEQVTIDGVEYTSYKIPSEFSYTIEDITAEVEKQNRIQAKLAIGQITDKACNDAFMYIQGANVERELTSEQKTQMVSLFAPALQAIQVKRPGQLKAYINSITPDEVLITTEMKEDLLEILKAF